MEATARYAVKGDKLAMSAKFASKRESCWRLMDNSVDRRMG